MAIAFVASGTEYRVDNSSSDAYTLNKPAGVSEGDLMLAMVAATAVTKSINPPTGWVQLGSTVLSTNSETPSIHFSILARTVGSSDPSSWNGTLGSASSRRHAIVVAYSGCADVSSQPLAMSSTETSTDSTTLVLPSVNNTDSAAWRISTGGSFQSSANGAPSTNDTTDRVTGVAGLITANVRAIWADSDGAIATGSTGGKTITFADTFGSAGGYTIVLEPESLGTSANAGAVSVTVAADDATTDAATNAFAGHAAVSATAQSPATATGVSGHAPVSATAYGVTVSTATQAQVGHASVSADAYGVLAGGGITLASAGLVEVGVQSCGQAPQRTVIHQVGSATEGNDGLSSSQTSVTINKPTGVADGDLMIATIHTNNQTVTAPSGWSLLDSQLSGVMRNHVYYKVASSEGSSYAWSIPNGSNIGGAITAWRGVHTANSFEDHDFTTSGTNEDEPRVGPSVTTAGQARMLYTRQLRSTSLSVAQFSTADSGVTELYENGMWTSVSYSQVMYARNDDTYSTGTQSGLGITSSLSETDNVSRTIALQADVVHNAYPAGVEATAFNPTVEAETVGTLGQPGPTSVTVTAEDATLDLDTFAFAGHAAVVSDVDEAARPQAGHASVAADAYGTGATAESEAHAPAAELTVAVDDVALDNETPVQAGHASLTVDVDDVQPESGGRAGRASLAFTSLAGQVVPALEIPAASAPPLRSDDFNRANSTTSLGTSSSGHAWTATTGTLGILGNEAYAPATANNQAFMDSGSSDVDVQATILGTERAGLTFRGAPTSSHLDCWRFQRFVGDGSVQLLKIEGGVVTGNLSQSVTVSSGSILRVIAVGDDIRCYVNNQLVISTTDSALQGNTWCGISITESTATLDNWSVSDTASVSVAASAQTATAVVTPDAGLAEVSASVDAVTLDLASSPAAGHAPATVEILEVNVGSGSFIHSPAAAISVGVDDATTDLEAKPGAGSASVSIDAEGVDPDLEARPAAGLAEGTIFPEPTEVDNITLAQAGEVAISITAENATLDLDTFAFAGAALPTALAGAAWISAVEYASVSATAYGVTTSLVAQPEAGSAPVSVGVDQPDAVNVSLSHAGSAPIEVSGEDSPVHFGALVTAVSVTAFTDDLPVKFGVNAGAADAAVNTFDTAVAGPIDALLPLLEGAFTGIRTTTTGSFVADLPPLTASVLVRGKIYGPLAATLPSGFSVSIGIETKVTGKRVFEVDPDDRTLYIPFEFARIQEIAAEVRVTVIKKDVPDGSKRFEV